MMARREPSQHLQPAEFVNIPRQILCIAHDERTGPMFNGLVHDGRSWRCLFFQHSEVELSSILDSAGLALEMWICADMFASILGHCAKYMGQRTLCPNWLWAKLKDVHGTQPRDPKASVETMLSTIGHAPTCVVRGGGWTQSRLVQVWK
ncbi:hypothetical protein CDEST_02036 [Colletotrichum destructivum]|uniref:Uncharacterized protein n=1 Tax=Colletotrichum destructivum TaxID=34406 RepID=A0AAX4I0V4_9PEZI|nr:hypothetical protein CDEST_02036 [Colletotrichum destructivum]